MNISDLCPKVGDLRCSQSKNNTPVKLYPNINNKFTIVIDVL